MNNYEVIANVPVLDAARELAAVPPPIWDEFSVRASYPGSAHTDTRAILYRGPSSFAHAFNPRAERSVRYPGLTGVRRLVNSVLEHLPVRDVGNIIIADLKPGGEITPHIDEGAYAEHYDRLHIAVTGECVFCVGGQPHRPKAGDVFLFNHRRMHYVINPFPESRTHIIVDLTLKE